MLLDDRNKNPGVKFADADLISAPIRIVVSPRNLENNMLEVKTIDSDTPIFINKEEILNYIENIRKGWIF